MASFQPCAAGWRVQINIKGERDSKTFPTKREGQLWAAQREIEMRAQSSGKTGEIKTTHDAFDRYTNEVSPKKKGARWEIVRLNKMKREFPCVILSKTTSDHVQQWRDMRKKSVKDSSVLREMKLLNSVFEECIVEWKWLKANPCKGVRRPSSGPSRKRTIKWREIKGILRALDYPTLKTARHAVAHAFLLALRTGMREGELASIKWENVHASHIHLPDVKAIGERSRDVPASKKAMRIVEKMRGYHGKNMFNCSAGSIDVQFRKARTRAELEGFTFHDSRHTAATWIGRSGKWGVLEMCAAFGWSDPKMAMIYFNPTASDLAAKL
jgi:integrase